MQTTAQQQQRSKGQLRHRMFAAARPGGGIKKNGIRRLAMRAGVKRLGTAVCTDGLAVLRAFMDNIIRDVVAITESGGRKTITARDVVRAFGRIDRRLYGFK